MSDPVVQNHLKPIKMFNIYNSYKYHPDRHSRIKKGGVHTEPGYKQVILRTPHSQRQPDIHSRIKKGGVHMKPGYERVILRSPHSQRHPNIVESERKAFTQTLGANESSYAVCIIKVFQIYIVGTRSVHTETGYKRVILRSPHSLPILNSKISLGDEPDTIREYKIIDAKSLALRVYLGGLNEPFGSFLRSRNPPNLEVVLRYVKEELDIRYFQNSNKQPQFNYENRSNNYQPKQNFNFSSYNKPNFDSNNRQTFKTNHNYRPNQFNNQNQSQRLNNNYRPQFKHNFNSQNKPFNNNFNNQQRPFNNFNNNHQRQNNNYNAFAPKRNYQPNFRPEPMQTKKCHKLKYLGLIFRLEENKTIQKLPLSMYFKQSERFCCYDFMEIRDIQLKFGIDTDKNSVRGKTTTIISSRFDSSKRYPLNVLLVEQISERLPPYKVCKHFISHLVDVPLADDMFDQPNQVDGIIGAELVPILLGSRKIFGSVHSPIAVETFCVSLIGRYVS
ncbi:hypothetical protein FQA39_LY15673 [Lamprigera yunnana]|nr:hypothetical protein FQA39_LY15673 [Lamprigera yunnana]